MRRAIALVSAFVVLAGVSGCGKGTPKLKDQLVSDIDRAQQQPHEFALVVTTGGKRYSVTGLVEDDARYSADVTIDDRLAWQEVASDDTLADRFADPAAVPMFLRPRAAQAKAALPNIPAELASGRWVVDEVGAPDLLSGSAETSAAGGHSRQLGQDPVLDAISALEYVRQIVSEQTFRPFNKNDLDYDPATDTFPKPTSGSALRRFDAVRTELPTAAQIQGFGGRATLPDAKNFRRMAIYVDGHNTVVRVMERIDVASRLNELLSNAGLTLPRGVGEQDAVDAVVESLNKLRVGQGDEPIDVHELDLALTPGDGKHVSLPTEATKGSLAVLIGRGQSASAGTSAVGGSA